MFLSSILALFLSPVMAPATASAADAAAPIRGVATRQSVSFDVWEETGMGNETFYSCDSLQTLTTSILQELGATHISVDCNGGLEDDGTWWGTPSLEAKFVSAQASNDSAAQAAQYAPTSLTGDDNCAAAQTIFDAVKGKFTMTGVSGNDGMCESYERFDIHARVLRLK